MVVMEMADEDVFQGILFAVQLLDQEVAHPVVVFGKSPIPAVDQQILALAPDQINAALDVAIEFVLGEGTVDARDTPTVRRLGPEENHPEKHPTQYGRYSERTWNVISCRR